MLILPSGRVIDRIRPRRQPARRHSIDKQIGQGVEKGLVIGSNQLLAIVVIILVLYRLLDRQQLLRSAEDDRSRRCRGSGHAG